MMHNDYGIHSSYWAYNQPGWKPLCVRCNKRKEDCHKYNSSDYGMFAGEWICSGCRKDTDTLTPAEKVGKR